MQTDKTLADEFFARLYGGAHNVPGKVKEYGRGWAITDTRDFATFDFAYATRLVFLAHDMCMRAEISSGGIGRVRIAAWVRKRDGSMSERHPTLEDAVSDWRERNAQPQPAVCTWVARDGFFYGTCGVNVEIVGNDPAKNVSAFCPTCGKVVSAIYKPAAPGKE